MGTGLVPQKRIFPRSRRVQKIVQEVEGILPVDFVVQQEASIQVRESEHIVAAELYHLETTIAFGEMLDIAWMGGRWRA